MKKSKIILAATGLLTLGGLTSCGANSRDVRPQYSVVFANCYTKDRTDARLETPANARVFPNWAYPNPYDFEDPSDAIFQDGILGYVGNGDKTNIGNYTVTGNTIYRQLGKDVDFTITLDDFVVLNPIDGELVEDPTSPSGYKVNNPEYFKIYVSSDDDYYYSYNQLREDKEYTLDDSTPGVYKFHIPGEYVKFSYKVFFSASYIDVIDLGFRGFDTLPYGEYPVVPGGQERKKATEFEKVVISSLPHAANGSSRRSLSNECYTVTNTGVGGDLSCVITPTNMGGGFTFTEDYLDKLEFWGLYIDATKHEQTFTNVTQYVNKNLVHYYGNVPNVIRYNGYDERKGGLTELIHTTSRTFPTNQYCCRVTFPWINSENTKGGLFTYKDGKYALNYDYILTTVKDEFVDAKLPSYIEKAELVKKFKVNTTTETGIAKATYDYVVVETKDQFTEDPINVPVLEIKLTAKDNWVIKPALCCDLIKITSKQSIDSYKYFKDLVIDDEEKAQSAFTGGPYRTEEYVDYIFGYNDFNSQDLSYTFNYSSEDEGKTATIRVNLNDLLQRIAIGPLSESTCINVGDPTQGIIPVTYGDAKGNATLDMIEGIEFGFHAQDSGSR